MLYGKLGMGNRDIAATTASGVRERRPVAAARKTWSALPDGASNSCHQRLVGKCVRHQLPAFEIAQGLSRLNQPEKPLRH